MDWIKIGASIAIIAIILNLILFALGRMSSLWFWIIIILCSVYAYLVVPKLRKQ